MVAIEDVHFIQKCDRLYREALDPMKARYIIITIIILYLALMAVATVFALGEESEPEHTATPTATATPTTPVSNCEQDKSDIQAALDAY